MKIRIADNARDLYRRNEPEDVFYPIEIDGTLSRLEGRTVEVDVRYLRKDRFTILPIPGLCKGVGIKMYAVTEVIDDIRPQAEALRVL